MSDENTRRHIRERTINGMVRATRDERQATIAARIREIVGDNGMTTASRTARMAEECIELMQALGMTKAAVIRMAEYVYSRPQGNIYQELGGVSVTLLALAQSWTYSLDQTEQDEIARLLNLPVSRFRDADARKKAAGLDSLD